LETALQAFARPLSVSLDEGAADINDCTAKPPAAIVPTHSVYTHMLDISTFDNDMDAFCIAALNVVEEWDVYAQADVDLQRPFQRHFDWIWLQSRLFKPNVDGC
jgi:hypothetical protein